MNPHESCYRPSQKIVNALSLKSMLTKAKAKTTRHTVRRCVPLIYAEWMIRMDYLEKFSDDNEV